MRRVGAAPGRPAEGWQDDGGIRMTARVAGAILSGIVCLVAARTQAAERPTSRPVPATLAEADKAGRDTWRSTLEGLPAHRMNAEDRGLVEYFKRSTTLHRRMPVETIHCSHELLEFVLAKPETLVDVWRVLGISRVSFDPMGPGRWRLEDGYGTTGTVRLVFQEKRPSGTTMIFHGRGGYSGPMAPKPLTGSCLIVVRHQAAVVAGRTAQKLEVEAFLDVDGLGLEIVTRTLQPLIARSAATNVHEICLFVDQLAHAARRNPSGMAVLAEQLPRTEAADRRMLSALASGRRTVLTHAPSAEDVSEELAARWMTADDLDAVRR